MESFRAYRVVREGKAVHAGVRRVAEEALSEHDVTVQVEYSSLNYKDALSARGHPGVTESYPHTPGIDAAGVVTHSRDERFAAGDRVIVTSYDLGVNTAGGFAERIRVPPEWIVPLPADMTTREAMALGTAGLTAGMAVRALDSWGVRPGDGPFVVTGASGGVGSVAVALLARLGAEVVASTGTKEAHDMLLRLGATRVVDRSELGEASDRPLGRATWAGAIDVAGGPTLANLVKQARVGGAVASCGMVQSADVELSVFPFILRGVGLLGIDSEKAPLDVRTEVWERFAGPWSVDVEPIVTDVALEDLDPYVDAILAGETVGRVRVVVDPA